MHPAGVFSGEIGLQGPRDNTWPGVEVLPRGSSGLGEYERAGPTCGGRVTAPWRRVARPSGKDCLGTGRTPDRESGLMCAASRPACWLALASAGLSRPEQTPRTRHRVAPNEGSAARARSSASQGAAHATRRETAGPRADHRAAGRDGPPALAAARPCRKARCRKARCRSSRVQRGRDSQLAAGDGAEGLGALIQGRRYWRPNR